ncbi:MAG TPA: hypothetical protein VG406_23700 [Isosphaeraceae bacterium]|jgi:hypothetical protein|nr:hypothetical protein [Isosphaeraceae bacterium]
MTYRGLNIFGPSPVWTPPGYRRDAMDTPYFGRDGIPSIDGGQRGGESSAAGVWVAPGVAALGLVVAAARALQDGQCGDLIDPFGIDWPDVVLAGFDPEPRVRLGPDGTALLRYTMTFLHLT